MFSVQDKQVKEQDNNQREVSQVFFRPFHLRQKLMHLPDLTNAQTGV